MKVTNMKEALIVWLGIILLIVTFLFPPYGYTKTRTDFIFDGRSDLNSSTNEVVSFTYIHHQFILSKPNDSVLTHTIYSSYMVATWATNIHIGWHILAIEDITVILLIGGIVFTLRKRI
ncbi:MAG TPA: hypothetical protein VGM58_04320 [Verrucomicrobiae bacterium]|jgi:hypothetical protein